MNRLSTIAALSGALLLGACAGDGAMMSEKRPATPPGGVWEVTEAAAVDAPATPPSPYLGQRLALYGQAAGDPAGRLCKAPRYLGYEASPSLVLGVAGSESLGPVLEVTCDGQPFGTYVGSADGALRTRVNAWLLTLRRTDAVEAAAVAPEPVVAAAPLPDPAPAATTATNTAPPPQPAVAPPPRRAGGALVYLASYRTAATARAGFDRLTPHSTVLAKAPMVLKEVDLGAKGRWVRLFAEAPDATQGKLLCAQLGKRLPACGMGWAK